MLIQSSLCLECWCGTELVITTIWLTGVLVTGCLSINRESSCRYIWCFGLAPGFKRKAEKNRERDKKKKPDKCDGGDILDP